MEKMGNIIAKEEMKKKKEKEVKFKGEHYISKEKGGKGGMVHISGEDQHYAPLKQLSQIRRHEYFR